MTCEDSEFQSVHDNDETFDRGESQQAVLGFSGAPQTLATGNPLRSPESVMVAEEEFVIPAENTEGYDAERIVSDDELDELNRLGDDEQRIVVHGDQTEDPEVS